MIEGLCVGTANRQELNDLCGKPYSSKQLAAEWSAKSPTYALSDTSIVTVL